MEESSKLKNISVLFSRFPCICVGYASVHQCYQWLVYSAFFLIVSAVSSAAEKPNIVFIMADDLGYGDVGYQGQKHILTPEIDRMAEEGMVFTDHYAGSTVCMPSRGTFMTGYHTGHGTIRGNPTWTVSGTAVDLTPEDQTVAQELKRAGYATAIVGKWGLSESNLDGMPTRQGFDYFYGYRSHYDAHHHYWPSLWRNEQTIHVDGNDYMNTEGQYVHDLVTEEALQYIEKHQKESFFLFVAYAIPHYELTVPQDSKDPYENLGWPVQPLKKAHYRHDADGNVAYAGMVSRLDRDVGRILDHLNELGMAENTLVIFTSDNGPVYEREDRFFNSNGPLRGGKRDLYEGGIRVPFVAWWPGKVEAGSVTDHPSAFWDFLPTACEIAGIQPTESDLNGISYLPTLLGQGEQKKHEVLYWEFNEGPGPIQAVRVGDFKGVKFMDKPMELYDLSKDLSETTNLSDTKPQEAARIQKILETTRTHSDEFPLTKRRNHGRL